MRLIVEGGSFFEAPRWHDGRWWVSDFFRHAVFSFEPDGGDIRQEAAVAGQPSGIGWHPDGALLVVSMLDHLLLRRDGTTGDLSTFADLSGHVGGPTNDMVVASDGTAWVGNFGFDFYGGGEPSTTSLVRVDTDGTVSEAADDLLFPNGAVITDDGRTLVVGETFRSRYTAFTIGAGGTLTDRRIWADLPGVLPDGCCLDAEDRIWCADAGGHRCVLVEEGGRIAREVTPPDGLGVFACMLGGATGTSLLMCCCPTGQPEETPNRRDAVLVSVEVEVPHAGRP